MARSPRRSPRWPAARRAHLAANPTCAACGSRSRLEVHHVRPYHLFPALELDPSNLMTLCEAASHNCHLIFGHCLSWKAWNAHARDDAAAYLGRLAARSTGAGGA